MNARRRLLSLALLTIGLGAWPLGVWLRSTLVHQPERSLPRQFPAPPTLAELNDSLALADGYIDGLYKPLPGGLAAMSEYYGFPLRLYLPEREEWLLLGLDGAEFLEPVASFATREDFRVAYTLPGGGSARLKITIDWHGDGRRAYVTVTTLHYRPVSGEDAIVFLGERMLGRLGATGRRHEFRIQLSRVARATLRSLRYTVRHSTQLGYAYYRYRGNRERADALAKLIEDSGFTLDYDLASPIWMRGHEHPDDLPYDLDTRDGRSAYQDCTADALHETPRAYYYRSKVCALWFSPAVYVWLTHADGLVPAAHAIHMLNRHGEPDRRYTQRWVEPPLPLGSSLAATVPPLPSARATAIKLENQYRALGHGIPQCLFGACDDTRASGVRTFQFGVLATLLGYAHGDEHSRAWADTVARSALEVQVGPDGRFPTDGGIFLRPSAAGSFLNSWDADLSWPLEPTWKQKLVDIMFNMPIEYEGLIPSNSETTLTAYAFLVRYRCERYGVGCSSAVRRACRSRPRSDRDRATRR